jgi:acyl-coenzyme A synthetase/AMP-(fatty) acid ligase
MGYINDARINAIFLMPTAMNSIAGSGALNAPNVPDLKLVMFGGEVMPTSLINTWRKKLPDVLYVNLYGPTEITVSCTYYIVDRDFDDTESLPIGKARKNMGVIILTDENQIALIGEVGELCVIGSSVALGYWGIKKHEQFTQHPQNPYFDQRLYRTGDLAFVGEDGLIRFVGRKDSQIKLRGRRIELEEIEMVIRSVEGVENACVMFDQQSEKIVAFIQSKTPMTLHGLRRHLIEKIPRTSFPSRLEVMEALPLTPSGKIDRTSLKDIME